MSNNRSAKHAKINWFSWSFSIKNTCTVWWCHWHSFVSSFCSLSHVFACIFICALLHTLLRIHACTIMYMYLHHVVYNYICTCTSTCTFLTIFVPYQIFLWDMRNLCFTVNVVTAFFGIINLLFCYNSVLVNDKNMHASWSVKLYVIDVRYNVNIK